MITYGSTTLTSYNTITKIEVYYYKSTSATSLSGGSWSTTKPTWENGKYIWQKIRTTYEGKLENGLYYSESDPVNITGQQGATGTAAYSYKLNASDTIITKSEKGEYSVSKITFTSTSKQGTNNVNAYAGRFKIETTANGTTWTTRYPTSGTGVDESSKEYTIPTDIIAIRCSLYQSGGFSTLLDIMTIPIINDGVGIIDSPYKEVEWVESTGKQYVYLDWKPPIKTWGFEVDFMSQNAVNTTAGGWNESTNKNGYGTIFGVRNSSGVNNAQLTSYNSGLLRIGNSTAIATAFKTDHSRQTIKLHGTTITRANGVTATVTRVDETTGKPYCNMTVFGLYEGLRRTSTGNITEPSSTRIYSLKFYDGDTLAVDLVGSIRKADGITGLYDKVSKHFYPAPGMLFGNEVGDITNVDTVADSLNKADVSTTVVNKNRTRMWETSVPFNRLEDGQKITVTYSYGNVVNSTQTSELVGWDDTSSNSNVYLRLTYPDGTKSEWIPCYYSQTARLTTHYGAGTAIIFTYRENLLSNATETTGGSAIVRGFFANASYYQNTSYTQYSNNVKAGTNGIKGYTLIMKDSEDTWSCFYSGAYKTTNTGKPAYTGGFMLGKILYSAGAGAQTSNSSLDTYYNYKSGVNTSTIYDAYPVDLRYSTNCASTLTSQRPVYIVGTIENDGLFHLDVSQWYTQTEPTYADGKVYVYVGMAYSSYQAWLSTENPTYMFYNGEFILYDKALTLQNINSLKTSLETQIDNKVETWCQKTNPANSWTAEERPNHTGDLWYYIGESGTTYKNNTTYQYNGETNVWSAYSANPDLFDKIDGKTAIYYGTTSSVTSAEEGDYLVDSENDCTYRWNDGAWVLATDYKQVAIDAIEIGGRNLIRNTADWKNCPYAGDTATINGEEFIAPTTTGTNWRRINGWFTKTKEDVYFSPIIISFDVKKSDETPLSELVFQLFTTSKAYKEQTSGNLPEGSRYYINLANSIWKNTENVNKDTWTRVYSIPIIMQERFNTTSYTEYDYLAFYIGVKAATSSASFRYLKIEKGNIVTDWTPAPEDVEDSIKVYAQSIQSQVDGMAEIHYGTVVPTLSNAPYTSWEDTTTRDMHVDDLYYNTSTGYCYRFIKSGSTYSWTRIKDSDITAAATAASNANTAAGNAQTTANNANTLAGQKRRIFVAQPTPPYEVGDLWVEGSNGDIKKCKTARATGSYTASDWELASKYTDDTTANTANTKVDNLKKVRLGWRVNHDGFSTSNNGECYFHGYNASNADADVDGVVDWNGADLTITKGMWINPNSAAPFNTPILHVYRTSVSPYHSDVWWDNTLKKWRGYMYTTSKVPGTVTDWTWDETTDCILATYVEPASETAIQSAQLFNPPKKFSEISDPNTIRDLAIDAVEIGGRNLFGLGSDCAISLSGMKTTNFSIVTEDGYKCAHATGALKTTAYLQSNIPFTPKPLEKVVFSADVKIKDIVLGTTNPMCEFYFSGQTINGTWRGQKASNTYVDGELVATGNSKFHLVLPSNEWHRVTVKWQFTDAEFTANMPPAIYFRDCTGELFVKNIKYERGTQETDWTPAPEDTQADIDTALAQSVEYIIGTQTAATNLWTGVTKDASLQVGKTIVYYLPYAGTTSAATLNLTLAGGGTTGAKNVRWNNTNVTNHYPQYSIITLTYDGTYWRTSAYNSDSTNKTRLQNNIIAAENITAGHIICGTSSGYQNIAPYIDFDLSMPILYAGSSIAKGATSGTRDNNYLANSGVNASTNGTIELGTIGKILYLKGTITGNTFHIAATPFMTTNTPNQEDDFYYIPLGIMYTTTNIYFQSSNRLYAYIDGAFQPVDTAAVLRAQDAKDRATAVYGTCSTGATTVDKVVTCSNFTLFDGARIQITFTNANTAVASEATTASPTLNINGTGRKPIKIGIEQANTANPLYWAAGTTIEFVYDGSAWVLQNAPYTLYGTCNTEENVREKQVVCDGAVICKGTTIYVDMLYSNTADSNSENGNVTLNVANTIAKTIYANNSTLTIRSRYNWNAGENPSFTFDGQYWQMDKDTVPAYITDKDEDGIFVHPINDTASGWSIGKVFELLNNGYSYIKMWLEDVTDNLSAKIRIGREDQHHILLDKEIIQFKKGDTPEELASFSSSGISFDDGVPFKIGNDSTYVQFVDNNSDGVADALEIVADKISFKNGGNNTVQDIQERFNDLQTDISNITNNIEINPTADTPYVAITTQKNEYNAGLKLEPTQLSFQLNGQTTATIANNEMNIPTASVTNLFMQSANQSYEKIWVMRSNGHLSLKVGKQN